MIILLSYNCTHITTHEYDENGCFEVYFFGLNKLKGKTLTAQGQNSGATAFSTTLTALMQNTLITSKHNLPINVTSIHMFLMYNCADW